MARKRQKTADVSLPLSRLDAEEWLRSRRIPFTHVVEGFSRTYMRIRVGYLNDFRIQYEASFSRANPSPQTIQVGNPSSGGGFRVGDRVELHPGTDAWMRGDRYGTVEKLGRKWVYVRMDKSGKLVRSMHGVSFSHINPVSQGKARQILHEGQIRGRSLTRAQRGYFGARASGAPLPNPPHVVGVLGAPIVLRYRHARDRKLYQHKFGRTARVELLSDGSVRICSTQGKPMWGDF